MNYVDGKLKIVELNLYAFRLKEEMNEKVNKIKEKNKLIKKEEQSVLNELKHFYLKGFKERLIGKEIDLKYIVRVECYGADVLGESTDYLRKYKEIVSDYENMKNLTKEDFIQYYSEMIILYKDVVNKFGTCNFEIFDKNFSSYVLKNVPTNDSNVVKLVNGIVNYNYDYQSIRHWFKLNALEIINIHDKWCGIQTEENDKIKEITNFYNEQISEVNAIIEEIKSGISKLKI